VGSPRYPTQKEIHELQQAADLPAAEAGRVENGMFTLELPTHGLAVIELK
jgi:hypothetical protein